MIHRYCIPDVVWDRIITLLSSSIRRRKKKKAGRPRMDYRKAMSAIFYVRRTGCQWNALPKGSVFKDRDTTDSRKGERLVFSSECGSMDCRYMIKKLGSIGNGRLWMALLQKRLLGEKSTGPNPTDRGEIKYKTQHLVDGKAIPLGVCVDGGQQA